MNEALTNLWEAFYRLEEMLMALDDSAKETPLRLAAGYVAEASARLEET